MFSTLAALAIGAGTISGLGGAWFFNRGSRRMVEDLVAVEEAIPALVQELVQEGLAEGFRSLEEAEQRRIQQAQWQAHIANLERQAAQMSQFQPRAAAPAMPSPAYTTPEVTQAIANLSQRMQAVMAAIPQPPATAPEDPRLG